MSYCRSQLVRLEEPSGDTTSVVVGDLDPPSNMTSPPVPGRDQQRWSRLSSLRMTEAREKVVPSIMRQERVPQSRRPHCVWSDISWGRSGREQEWPELGL